MIKFILIAIGILFIYILIGLILYTLSTSKFEVVTDPETWLIVILWPIAIIFLFLFLILLILIEVINKIFKTNIEL